MGWTRVTKHDNVTWLDQCDWLNLSPKKSHIAEEDPWTHSTGLS